MKFKYLKILIISMLIQLWFLPVITFKYGALIVPLIALGILFDERLDMSKLCWVALFIVFSDLLGPYKSGYLSISFFIVLALIHLSRKVIYFPRSVIGISLFSLMGGLVYYLFLEKLIFLFF